MTDQRAAADGAPSRTSTSLLRRARTMDAASWRRLVEAYGPTIYGWCRRAGFQKADAADLSQEVFAAVARGLGQFRRDRDGDSFRQWIRTITLNKIRNAWQRCPPASQGIGGSSWQQRLGELAADESASSISSAREIHLDEARQRALQQVRLEVTERDWSILERLIIDERPPDAVANEFGISVGLVYVIRSRLLKRLRDLMLCATGSASVPERLLYASEDTGGASGTQAQDLKALGQRRERF